VIWYVPRVNLALPFSWPETDPLQDDALTGSFRVWQRQRGHRYSLDDVLTARAALEIRPQANRYLDLGCGIGSVLLMVAERLEAEEIVGIEAQEISFSLAEQNIARNGVADRITLLLGDFREPGHAEPVNGRFDLITGTPPYMPIGRGTPSPDAQRAYARMEFRGGVEAYLEAIAARLAPRGRAIICADGRTPKRVMEAASATGLCPLARQDAYPRAGRESPLFTVWTVGWSGEGGELLTRAPFIARDAAGQRTSEYRALRAFFGLASEAGA